MSWPNRITIARILLIGPFVICLLNLNELDSTTLRWLAVVIFAAMALSDLLDGFLARRLDAISALGQFLDPLADKLLITAAVVILAVIGIRDGSDADPERFLYLPNWVAVTAIGKDVFVSLGFLVVYLLTGKVFIQPRPLGKACTVLQLFLVLCMLLWPDLPAWLSGLPGILWYGATALAIIAALDYVMLGSRFLATDS